MGKEDEIAVGEQAEEGEAAEFKVFVLYCIQVFI